MVGNWAECLCTYMMYGTSTSRFATSPTPHILSLFNSSLFPSPLLLTLTFQEALQATERTAGQFYAAARDVLSLYRALSSLPSTAVSCDSFGIKAPQGPHGVLHCRLWSTRH